MLRRSLIGPAGRRCRRAGLRLFEPHRESNSSWIGAYRRDRALSLVGLNRPAARRMLGRHAGSTVFVWRRETWPRTSLEEKATVLPDPSRGQSVSNRAPRNAADASASPG